MGLAARPSRPSRGFTLVTVVWGLGLLAVVATVITIGTRYRARDAATTILLADGAAASESAVNLAILRAMDAEPTFWRDPRFGCWLPDGTLVRVAIEPESGKIDLNAADAALLTRLFTALGSADFGRRLAMRVITYRAPANGGSERPNVAADATSDEDGTKGRPFLSVRELDQIADIPPAMLRRAARFLTTRSGRPDLDLAYATPMLRDLLRLDVSKVERTTRHDAPGEVTIRADVLTPRGARLVREALVGLGDAEQSFTVHEWRRADIEPAGGAEVATQAPCLP